MADYNFFAKYEKQKGLHIDIRSPYFWGIMIVLVCVLISCGLIARNIVFNIQIKSIHEEITKTQETEAYQDARELQKSLDAMTQYDAKAELALLNFENADFLDTELIRGIIKCIPQNGVITSVGIDGQNLGLICEVPNRKTASELLLNLKESSLFESIQMHSVDSTGNGVSVSFSGVLKAGDAE